MIKKIMLHLRKALDQFNQNLYSIGEILISQGDTKQPLTLSQTAELRIKNMVRWVDQITVQFFLPFLKAQGCMLFFCGAVKFQMLPNRATL